ncbi:hypothetical protein A4A49_55855, partial [Nicotiana attenuata]
KKFSIPTRGERYVIKSLGKKWKDYKCDLKSKYTSKYKTKDALPKNRPSRIPRDQWTGLVSYWLSDKAKVSTSYVLKTHLTTFNFFSWIVFISTERSNDQPPHSVAWEGDVYSQVLGNEKSGYVRGLGLSPTPSILWGSKSSIENLVPEDSCNDIRRLEQKVTELTEQIMSKIAPNELLSQNINRFSTEQVPDGNSGYERVAQVQRMHSVSENTSSSHGT